MMYLDYYLGLHFPAKVKSILLGNKNAGILETSSTVLFRSSANYMDRSVTFPWTLLGFWVAGYHLKAAICLFSRSNVRTDRQPLWEAAREPVP